jgi:tetratricopeptide (TPR) repeat protein
MLPPPLDILRRALKHSANNSLDEAIEVISEGIALCESDPEHLASLPRLTSNLGLFYRRAGRLDEAIGAVRRSLLSCPNDRQLLHFLSDLLLETGDVSAAALVAVQLRAVCESNPDTFSPDWQEAVSLLEKRIAG